MTAKVIHDMPFISSLYHFLTEHDGIATHPFEQKVNFEFASKFDIDIDKGLNALISLLRLNIEFLKVVN